MVGGRWLVIKREKGAGGRGAARWRAERRQGPIWLGGSILAACLLRCFKGWRRACRAAARSAMPGLARPCARPASGFLRNPGHAASVARWRSPMPIRLVLPAWQRPARWIRLWPPSAMAIPGRMWCRNSNFGRSRPGLPRVRQRTKTRQLASLYRRRQPKVRSYVRAHHAGQAQPLCGGVCRR